MACVNEFYSKIRFKEGYLFTLGAFQTRYKHNSSIMVAYSTVLQHAFKPQKTTLEFVSPGIIVRGEVVFVRFLSSKVIFLFFMRLASSLHQAFLNLFTFPTTDKSSANLVMNQLKWNGIMSCWTCLIPGEKGKKRPSSLTSLERSFLSDLRSTTNTALNRSKRTSMLISEATREDPS